MSAVVLDTSVLIAGLLSPRGAASSLVDAFFADRLKLAFTPATFAEYVEVMERSEFADVITSADRMAIMLKLNASGLKVKPAPVPAAAWPDPDDLPFVAAALATKKPVIVTLNPRDFAPALKIGVQILSPSEARRLLL